MKPNFQVDILFRFKLSPQDMQSSEPIDKQDLKF